MNPDSKVHRANMRPIWGRHDAGGPHVGPMNFAIWEILPDVRQRLIYPLCSVPNISMRGARPTRIILLYYWSYSSWIFQSHYNDVIMVSMSSKLTSLTIVYTTVYSETDQRKHQSFASLAFVREIHRCPVNSPHKWPVTRKMFPFDDVIV